MRNKTILIIIFNYFLFLCIFFHFNNFFEYKTKNDVQNLIFNDIISLFLINLIILLYYSQLNYKYTQFNDKFNIIKNIFINFKIFKNSNYKNNDNKDKFKFYLNNFYNKNFEKLKSYNSLNEIFILCLKYLNKTIRKNDEKEINEFLEEQIVYFESYINKINFLKERRSYGIYGITFNYELINIIIFGLMPIIINYLLEYYYKKNN